MSEFNEEVPNNTDWAIEGLSYGEGQAPPSTDVEPASLEPASLANTFWTDSENQLLLQFWNVDNLSTADCALQLRRTEGAIQSQLAKLECARLLTRKFGQWERKMDQIALTDSYEPATTRVGARWSPGESAKLVHLWTQERCGVKECARRLWRTVNAVSSQLSKLDAAGLVSFGRRGNIEPLKRSDAKSAHAASLKREMEVPLQPSSDAKSADAASLKRHLEAPLQPACLERELEVLRSCATATQQDEYRRFTSGSSFSDISAARGVKIGTVVDNIIGALQCFAVHEHPIFRLWDRFGISDDDRAQVTQAVDSLGGDLNMKHKPLKEKLGASFSYDTIRFCLLRLKVERQPKQEAS